MISVLTQVHSTGILKVSLAKKRQSAQNTGSERKERQTTCLNQPPGWCQCSTLCSVEDMIPTGNNTSGKNKDSIVYEIPCIVLLKILMRPHER